MFSFWKPWVWESIINYLKLCLGVDSLGKEQTTTLYGIVKMLKIWTLLKKILAIMTITAQTKIKTNLSFDFPNSHGYCICNHVNTFHCYGDYIVYLFIVQPWLQFTFSKKKIKRLKNAKLMFTYFHNFSFISFPKK